VILAGPLLLSIFPDGRFLSARWRAIAMVGVAVGVGSMVAQAFQAGPLNNFSLIANPVGILPLDLVGVLVLPTSVGLVLTLVACAASLFVRFRTADRDGRQQLKWFAASAFLLALAGPLGFSLGKPGQVLFISALCTIPLATGLTVLRYGLYEIDTVINRAIVYGLLTAILAGLYTASVGLMQRVTRLFTEADTDAAVILTTLLVVTAFTPVKGWLQARVDRRFKESRDPGARLSAFVDDLQASFARPDTERTLRRLLRLIVEACDLQGGRIELDRPDSTVWAYADGEIHGEPLTLGPFALGDGTVRLLAGPPKRRPTLGTRDRTAIESALTAVAAELGSEEPNQGLSTA